MLKALEDLEDAGVEASDFPKLLGYSDATDLIEAVEAAEKIPPIKRTPNNSANFDNPDFNFIPDYFVINDFLAHTLYEEGILFMTQEYFDNNPNTQPYFILVTAGRNGLATDLMKYLTKHPQVTDIVYIACGRESLRKNIEENEDMIVRNVILMDEFPNTNSNNSIVHFQKEFKSSMS